LHAPLRKRLQRPQPGKLQPLEAPGAAADNFPRTMYQTAARKQTLELLKSERRYLTATAIHRLLKPRAPKLALSTIYRTLEALQESGTVTNRVDSNGEASYIYCGEQHHHHAIYRGCGHVDEVDCNAIGAFATALLDKQSFRLDDHSIEFYGLCARCR
jgi:Fur family transcriptional regulator, ferric uptake regulator